MITEFSLFHFWGQLTSRPLIDSVGNALSNHIESGLT